MAISYFLSSNHAAPSVDLNQLVNGANPSGILKIFHVADRDYASAELAVPATLLDSGDYMLGSTTLVGVQNTVESLGGGGLLVGVDSSPFSEPLTVSSGEVGSILAITQKLPTGKLEWVGGAPLDGQFLGYTTADGIKWADNPSGSVTSVNADSTTGLLVSVENTTTTPLIHINMPGSGVDASIVAGDMIRGALNTYEAVPIGTDGDVWTVSGSQASWQAPVTLPAGIAVLTALAAPWNGFTGFVYDDDNIRDGTIVNATSASLIGSGDNDRVSVSGYIFVVVYPNGFGSHTSPCFVVFSNDEADIGKGVSWSISTYNGTINN